MSFSTDDPFEWFDKWFERARRENIDYPNAMTLSTVSEGGHPTSRVVLMKDYSSDGLIFYTNYRSRKAADIESNPEVALNFYWRPLALQVRIEGMAERLEADRSDEYFETRPRGSQIGAWASEQSSKLESRKKLEERYETFRKKFDGQPVPRPEHWGGYRVKPQMFEFWKGQEDRLHDRWRFERIDENDWEMYRLYP